MSVTQVGTGGLTLGAPQTAAATYITVPAGAIVESVTVTPAGDAQMETQYDSDGAFHTDLWYEKRCTGAVIVLVGADYTKAITTLEPTLVTGPYCVMSVVKEYSKGPIRITVTVKKVIHA